VQELLQGNRRALARLISLVENDDKRKAEVLPELYRHTGKAYVIGITGSPGSGKSSLVDRLLESVRRDELTAGVIAVDPSSPFTGGAILGDRIRMQEHALDPGVFIRSMGTRGNLGGLSRATREAIQIFDAFGMDLVMVETVGVGQSEVDIVKYADTTVVVLTPAGGDSVQTIKAGIMEIGDIFVVNKADYPGTERTVAELNAMLDMKGAEDWRAPVLPTVAVRGEGVDRLWEAVLRHRELLESSGRLQAVRRERARQELADQLEHLVKSWIWEKIRARVPYEEMVEKIMARSMDPYSGAYRLLEEIDFPLPQ
jgi:LAO/AO transport system kinase